MIWRGKMAKEKQVVNLQRQARDEVESLVMDTWLTTPEVLEDVILKLQQIAQELKALE